MTRRHSALLLLVALLPVGCAPSDAVTVQGAGATFPAPLSKRWFLEYNLAHPEVRVNYQAIGSGAGVSQLQAGLTDFAESDEALSKAKLAEVAKAIGERDGTPVELMQVPITGGAVALCYNLPGDPDLQLPRLVYVGMALGEVTHWDDEALKKANPGVELPHLPITFVRRAESSGTTFVFTTHLAAIDDRWKLDKDRKPGSTLLKSADGPGASKSPQWKVGLGGKGNSGVAALVGQTPGAFGYLEAGYAELAKLKVARLQNRAGAYVLPASENARVGLEEAVFNDVFGTTVPDPKATDAYPIVTFTWAVTRTRYADRRVGDALRSVLDYCLEDAPGQGQGLSRSLGYVKLPQETLGKARRAVRAINADPTPEPPQ